MAPIVDHHAAMAEALSSDHSVASGSSSAAHLAVKKAEGQLFGSPKIVVSDDEFDLPRIGDMITHANNNSSLFMDECQNDSVSGIFPEEFITTADMKTSALMSSFDALDGTLDDIDLLSSPRSTPCKEQLLHDIQPDSSAAAAIMFSTDEELARQLQAEEDEYARQQRDVIFRKGQSSAAAAAATSSPPRKLKRSWLDDLIGEPFPSEMRRNYARSDSRQSTTSTSSGLMAAIAAAEARVTSAAIDSSILVDRTNTDSISSFNVDEGINKLSSTLSNWWSSNVVISPQNNNQDDPTLSSEDPPRFTDNGIEGYYLGDFLTDTNNNNPIQPLQRHGQGIMTYNSGDTFTGNFQNNVFHGWGIYLWNDGDKQRGTWYNGLRHGPCIFHHSASDIVEYGYYNEGKVVGEGVRLNAERNKAWKLVDGVRLEGTIEMEEAERIVSERFECFPIPVPAKKRFVVFDEKEREEDFI